MTSISTRTKQIFISTSLVYYLTYCCIPIWAPFFPGEAAQRGVGSTEVGFIFGTYSLVAFLSSLFHGSFLIPKIGPYYALLGGVFVNGVTNIANGFGNLIEDRVFFSLFFLLTRTVAALGGSACEMSIIVILAQELKENVAVAVGAIEVFTGFGLASGPAIGGFLYKFGGFRLPMVFMGSLLLLSLLVVWLLLPKQEYAKAQDSQEKKIKLFKEIISIPGVSMMCVTACICYIAITFFQPILQTHAEKFGIDEAGVALLFLGASGAYTVAAPIVGCVMNKKSWKRFSIVLGTMMVALSMLFIGPAPFLSFLPQRSVWLLAISLTVRGFVNAWYFVPILPEMIHCCQDADLPQSLQVHAIISCLYTGSSNLGAFAGPFIGGILNDIVGFPWCSSIIAFILILKAAMTSLFFALNRRKDHKGQDDYEKIIGSVEIKEITKSPP